MQGRNGEYAAKLAFASSACCLHSFTFAFGFLLQMP
jgi:hypothetical protein